MTIQLWNETMETLAGEELEALQIEKLRELLIRVYEKSPYYRDKFDRAGVNPHEFRSLEQYSAYPTFDKYEERDSQARSKAELGHPLGMHITCNISEVNRMSASSGTTGTPSFQGHTRGDRIIQHENYARAFARIGLHPGDRVIFAGVMSMWVAGLPTLDAMMEYGINTIPIGALVGSVKVAEMAGLTRPKGILATPSFLRHMLKKARVETGVNLAEVGVEKLVVFGEPGGNVPEVIQELSEGFGGAEVYDIFGGTSCLNPIFISCQAHAGMHFFAPDTAYVELRDTDTGAFIPIKDGAEGEMIYTGLGRECGPLIRFRDGDRMRVHTSPCACGQTGWRMEVLGRVDDMLLVKGVNVFPSAIQDVARGFEQELTGNVRILKFDDSPVIEPPLQLWAECVGARDAAEKSTVATKLQAEIQRVLRFRAEVTLFDEGEMETEYGATLKAKLIKKMFT